MKLERAKRAIDRLKLERKILLEYLEKLSSHPDSNIDNYATDASEDRLVDSNLAAATTQPTSQIPRPQQQQQPTPTQQQKKSKQPKSQTTTAATTKKRKTSHGPKDPNAPKRPANAFVVYSQMARDRVRQENPEMSKTEIARQLGAEWKALDSSEKRQYYDIFEQQKTKYEQEKRIYDSRLNANNNNPSESVDELDRALGRIIGGGGDESSNISSSQIIMRNNGVNEIDELEDDDFGSNVHDSAGDISVDDDDED